MGYTHYWELDKKEAPTAEKWLEVMKEVSELTKGNKDLVWESDRPYRRPQADNWIVRFNGLEEQGHETFFVSRLDSGFHFCKTARKPYDKEVVAVLKILKRHFPKWISLSSDGGDKVFE